MTITITYRLHSGAIRQYSNVPTEWLAALAALAGLLEADTATYLGDHSHPGHCLTSAADDGFWTVDIDAFEVQL